MSMTLLPRKPSSPSKDHMNVTLLPRKPNPPPPKDHMSTTLLPRKPNLPEMRIQLSMGVWGKALTRMRGKRRRTHWPWLWTKKTRSWEEEGEGEGKQTRTLVRALWLLVCFQALQSHPRRRVRNCPQRYEDWWSRRVPRPPRRQLLLSNLRATWKRASCLMTPP